MYRGLQLPSSATMNAEVAGGGHCPMFARVDHVSAGREASGRGICAGSILLAELAAGDAFAVLPYDPAVAALAGW